MRRFAYSSCLLAAMVSGRFSISEVDAAQQSDVIIRIPKPPAANTQPLGEEVRSADASTRLPTGAKRLSEIRISSAPPAGEVPADRSVTVFASEGTRLDGARDWYGYELNWSPTALCHKTLYFDDVVLEQYGQTICPAAQPVLSASRFFATIPLMPARLLATPPCSAAYSSFGHPRPGTPACCLRQNVVH